MYLETERLTMSRHTKISQKVTRQMLWLQMVSDFIDFFVNFSICLTSSIVIFLWRLSFVFNLVFNMKNDQWGFFLRLLLLFVDVNTTHPLSLLLMLMIFGSAPWLTMALTCCELLWLRLFRMWQRQEVASVDRSVPVSSLGSITTTSGNTCLTMGGTSTLIILCMYIYIYCKGCTSSGTCPPIISQHILYRPNLLHWLSWLIISLPSKKQNHFNKTMHHCWTWFLWQPVLAVFWAPAVNVLCGGLEKWLRALAGCRSYSGIIIRPLFKTGSWII